MQDLATFTRTAITSQGTGEPWRPAPSITSPPAGTSDVLLLPRDNARHTRSIELEYRQAIRAARHEVVIANAYFFPGYGFLRDLRRAARRGVKVSLIFPGEPDTQLARLAAHSLYRHLLDAGVHIHEYCKRPFHGKVAVIDDDWSTVGSSNLDPLSLSLNLEANVFIRDRELARHLLARLDELLQHVFRRVDSASVRRVRFWHVLTRPLIFHCLRKFPDWAGWVPSHTPRTALATPPAPAPDAGAPEAGAATPEEKP